MIYENQYNGIWVKYEYNDLSELIYLENSNGVSEKYGYDYKKEWYIVKVFLMKVLHVNMMN